MEVEWNEAEIVQLTNFYETNLCLYDPEVKKVQKQTEKELKNEKSP